LVLDLDETMIHYPEENISNLEDISKLLLIRPFIYNFLEGIK